MCDAARIIVAGGGPGPRRHLVGLLHHAGFTAAIEASTVAEVAASAPDGHGREVLLVLMGDDVVGACAAVRQEPVLASVPVLAVVADDAGGAQTAATAAIAAGADDVTLQPVDPGIVIARVRTLLRAAEDRELARLARLIHETVVELLEAFSNEEDVVESIRAALERSLAVMGFERAAVILASDLSESGLLLCSSDDLMSSRSPVNLDAYPEARAAMQAGEAMAVGNVALDPLLAARAGRLVEAGVRAAAAFPLEWRGRMRGAIVYRSARSSIVPLDGQRLALGRILAAAVSQRIGDNQGLEAAREQTNRLSLVRYESERRSRALDQMKEYFEAASDGVAVVDGDGIVLFINRAAETITGFALGGLIGHPLGELVPDEQRALLEDVVVQVLGGTNLEAFDLSFLTSSGEPLTVSVTTSTVLAEHGAAILSFRDVTEKRVLETELRTTKEFLERLIDSAADAIVAADFAGRMILFNRGAERLFGWAADEVIGGPIGFEQLFPEGVARQIVRMLHSASVGGVGRLELSRREVLAKSGEVVPVNMSAAVLYEDGREVALVGIISDLRERIRIEQRLLQAQEKLVVSEKQALVAELAGATAHELNQPLTSVMGYAELLRKRMKPDEPHYRTVDTILHEAERMAEIVRKIGRITHYETKAYVGSAQILDIDKSAGAAGRADVGEGQGQGLTSAPGLEAGGPERPGRGA